MKRDPLYYALVVVGILVLAWFGAGDKEPPAQPVAVSAPTAPGELRGYNESKVKVTMYSLTTCGYCKAMGRELTARNIAYVERFIDVEPGVRDELNSKLKHTGIRPGPIGTPTMEVNGVMLPHNPSIRAVLKQLKGS